MLSFDIGVALKKSGSSLDPKLLEAFIRIESGGKGFDDKTGRILIQFEPFWYRKKAPYAPSGAWSVNKVDVQSKEWIAFNNAYDLNPVAAMESTSIGLPQIMGFHWKRLGYGSVSDMWQSFTNSLIEQLCALIRFIETDKSLFKAFQEKDWHKMAYFYNGSGYMTQAHRLGIKPYNEQLKEAYERLSKS
jgi:hypothetical protein